MTTRRSMTTIRDWPFLGRRVPHFTPPPHPPSPSYYINPINPYDNLGYETGHSLVEESLIVTPPSPSPSIILSFFIYIIEGYETGHSLVEESLIPTCDELIKEAEQRGN